MKEITKEMIDIWEMSNMDWMGYTLEKKEHFFISSFNNS